MNSFSPEEMLANWEKFLGYIEEYVTGDRKQQMLDFYTKYEERLVVMPASTKVGHHSWFAGGYIHHVNNVVECSLRINEIWKQMGVASDRYTTEELVFSAINHDLGKMGDSVNEIYLPNPSQWHIDNQGAHYIHSPKVQFMTVPDRSLFLLQEHGIRYNQNEFLAIKTHDGLYEKGNEQYLMTYSPDQKMYASLPYILHQGDLMAARIEFEQQFKPKNAPAASTTGLKTPKESSKDKSLKRTVSKDGLANSFLESVNKIK